MTDAEKITELREALKVAMDQWAGWLDEARGVTPKECDSEAWADCEHALVLTDPGVA